jgi:hypothetical protein
MESVAKGVFGEALRIANENSLNNLKIYVNMNGWGAYKEVDNSEHSKLKKMLGTINPMRTHIKTGNLKISRMMGQIHKNDPYMFIVNTNSEELPFLKGQDAHYYTMKEEDYKVAMEVLK